MEKETVKLKETGKAKAKETVNEKETVMETPEPALHFEDIPLN